jgi:hypothetical protein
MAAVTQREQARRNGTEIDDGKKERRERVDAEMRPEPWNSEREHQAFRRGGTEQMS